jgi:hypothetical protein
MELLVIGALAALGYAMRDAPIRERTRILKAPRGVPDDTKAIEARFRAAKNPLQTGVFANKALAAREPPLMPMFSSRNPQHLASVKLGKLETFTGTDALGGIGLRPKKVEKPALFRPEENLQPVSFSGSAGNLDYVPDPSRFLPSNSHQNVSCTQGFMDAPADPLRIRPTMIVPHQKPAEFMLPDPGTGLSGGLPVARAPVASAPVTSKKHAERMFKNEGLNATTPYDHQARQATPRVQKQLKAFKVQPREYFGGAKQYAMDEYGAPPIQQGRDNRTGCEYDYFGSGIRIHQDPALLPGHQDNRKTMPALPRTAPAAPSVVPDALARVSRYQQRSKRHPGMPYPGLDGNRVISEQPMVVDSASMSRRVEDPAYPAIPQPVFGKTHATSVGDVRPKVNAESLLPMNIVSRAVGTTERFASKVQVPDRQYDPFNVGHVASHSIPNRPPVDPQTECRDVLYVKDPRVNPQVRYATDQVLEGQAFCREPLQVPESLTAPLPHVVPNQEAPGMPQTTVVPKHCDMENPHPPASHLDLEGFASPF